VTCGQGIGRHVGESRVDGPVEISICEADERSYILRAQRALKLLFRRWRDF
jgi:hypothetical protein